MMRWLALAVTLAAPVQAGTLEGRLVTFTVETWDDPEAPLLVARGRTVVVGTGRSKAHRNESGKLRRVAR